MKKIDYLAKTNKLTSIIFLCLISVSALADKAYSQASISSSAMFMNAGTTTTINNIVTDTNTGVTINLSQTITNTGVITTVSAESVLPSGLFYDGIAVVTPTYQARTDLGPGVINVVSSLSIGSTGGVQAVAPNVSFNRAAAQTLRDAAANNIMDPNLELIIGIIRAGAGINGLD